jgi:hypothetical protein
MFSLHRAHSVRAYRRICYWPLLCELERRAVPGFLAADLFAEVRQNA